MIWHVTPVNDLRGHNTEDTICECEPIINVINGDLLIIHNAFDQREILEQVNEILEQ
jgi:hypothetical protein